MPQQKYNVVFRGQLVDGIGLEDAATAFSRRFSLDLDKVRGILGKRHFVLKRNVDEISGAKYQQAFVDIGVVTDLEPNAEASLSQEGRVTPSASQPPPAKQDTSSEDNRYGNEAAASVESSALREVPFQFNGRGSEYFKIWIVNILLTIVTLGIYSAWAKVRNKRYFYGNTVIEGSSFEYLATPMQILKGRMLAAAVFVIYSVVGQFLPIAGAVLGIALLLFMPWAILRSFQFNALNSAYRNVRFRFESTLGQSAQAFVLWPTLGLLSLAS